MPWVESLPSGKYRARYYLPGGGKRTVKESFTHKRAAQNAAAAAEANAQSLGWRDPRAGARPWGEWCDEWWPTRGVELGTEHRDRSSRDSCLIPRWGATPLVDINRHDIKAWAAELAGGGMSPATVQKRVYLLSASLVGAVDAGLITANLAARITLARGQTDKRRYLTEGEESRLLAQFRPPARRSVSEAFVPTLFGTGMRWGEAAGLQISRVDLARGIIRVIEVWDDEVGRLKAYPKGRKIRDVPIPGWLKPLLAREIGDRTSGFVFLHNGRVLDYSNWRTRVWIPAVERSGLAGTRPHDARHTYASRLLRNGVSLAEVGHLLGHVSASTTQIYAWLSEVPRESVLAALGDPFTPRLPHATNS